MSEERPGCPRCGSHHPVKNGRIYHKKPKHKCQDCGRQFVEHPTKKYILPSVIEYIDKMLLEKIPLVGIVRVSGVSKTWLQNYVNNLYSQVPQQLEVTFKPTKKLTIECDEVSAELSRMFHRRDNSRRVICQ
jgi:transposase-like protein